MDKNYQILGAVGGLCGFLIVNWLYNRHQQKQIKAEREAMIQQARRNGFIYDEFQFDEFKPDKFQE